MDTPITKIMTAPAVTTTPETPLVEAAELITKNHFNGIPVADNDGVLQGLLTEYDLISAGSAIHLPTLQKVVGSLSVFTKDKKDFSEDVEEVMKLKVSDVMNKEPLTMQSSQTLGDAVQIFREHHRVNPIPVLDEENKVVGVVSRFDLLKPVE